MLELAGTGDDGRPGCSAADAPKDDAAHRGLRHDRRGIERDRPGKVAERAPARPRDLRGAAARALLGRRRARHDPDAERVFARPKRRWSGSTSSSPSWSRRSPCRTVSSSRAPRRPRARWTSRARLRRAERRCVALERDRVGRRTPQVSALAQPPEPARSSSSAATRKISPGAAAQPAKISRGPFGLSFGEGDSA